MLIYSKGEILRDAHVLEHFSFKLNAFKIKSGWNCIFYCIPKIALKVQVLIYLFIFDFITESSEYLFY